MSWNDFISASAEERSEELAEEERKLSEACSQLLATSELISLYRENEKLLKAEIANLMESHLRTTEIEIADYAVKVERKPKLKWDLEKVEEIAERLVPDLLPSFVDRQPSHKINSRKYATAKTSEAELFSAALTIDSDVDPTVTVKRKKP